VVCTISKTFISTFLLQGDEGSGLGEFNPDIKAQQKQQGWPPDDGRGAASESSIVFCNYRFCEQMNFDN
jgi:hypothetical protein